MKKSLHIILALCIGLMIGLTATAYGESNEFVQASFAKFKFIVNGEEKELDADPLVYQGSTYLPVRTILNAVGYDVGFLSESRTITADKTIESLIEESERISSEEGVEVDATNSVAEQIKDIDRQIEIAEKGIKTSQRMLDTIDEDTEKFIPTIQQSIERNKQKLTELEAKKAELQAQQ